MKTCVIHVVLLCHMHHEKRHNLYYLLNAVRSTILLEKLTVALEVKKCPFVKREGSLQCSKELANN
jgi:hypothetical protein